MSRLKVDQIEDRSGSGITIDDAIKIDTISEKTSGSGVTIDGVLIKRRQCRWRRCIWY